MWSLKAMQRVSSGAHGLRRFNSRCLLLARGGGTAATAAIWRREAACVAWRCALSARHCEAAARSSSRKADRLRPTIRFAAAKLAFRHGCTATRQWAVLRSNRK
jgi:hypothetical protein